MQEVTTTASLVEYSTLEGEGPVTAVLARTDIEAALAIDSPGLWFDVGYEDDDAGRLAISLAPADLEEILRVSEGDEVTLALDGDWVTGAFADPPDVEAHGLRGAIAIAVVAGAIAAPAGMAATPQVSGAATPQVSSASVESQVSSAAARSQVSRRRVEPGLARRVEVAGVAREVVDQEGRRRRAQSQPEVTTDAIEGQAPQGPALHRSRK